MTETTRVLIVPGLWNSGPQHWQSVWSAAEPGFRRVEQTEWESPARTDWVAALEAAVADAGPQVVIAAHSLGCVTVAHWAAETGLKVRGALLVAPSDVDALIYPKGPTGFRPMPMAMLPFPSILVASEDDPWIKPSRARQVAEAWGSRFVSAGAAGHLNTESGHGPWPDGRRLLDEILLG
ncbi:MAG TPA: alpha/beta fold hydrolase [Thermoanaerobaculia bacterium]|jgi:predicted alpha/beta hydrolase family esterase|nr:alpha/beta fold hydrolase [Thermoanaerobaculia bacterium]